MKTVCKAVAKIVAGTVAGLAGMAAVLLLNIVAAVLG